ncbi:MAG: DUF4215 domain-containing protein, partial [bacterium]
TVSSDGTVVSEEAVGIVSPDGNMFMLVDTGATGGIGFAIGVKTSSGITDTGVTSNYGMYMFGTDYDGEGGWYTNTEYGQLTIDGAGHGAYDMIDNSSGSPDTGDPVLYTLSSDGTLDIEYDDNNGIITPDGSIMIMADAVLTEDYYIQISIAMLDEAMTALPVCGNGTVETGETCDDGNTTADDGCSATCQEEGAGPTGVRLDAGTSHTCAVNTSGAVKCWGYNERGQVGDGTATMAVLVPTQVSGLTSGYVEVAAGEGHSCAVSSAGAVKCWGWNNHGQLGNGSTTDSLTPVDVSGLTGVVKISAGWDFTCAVLSDGTAKCWGNNQNGQLGNGSTATSTVPVAVTGLTGVVDIEAGEYHACVLHSDDTVQCWGKNEYGQLGNGSTTDSTTIAGSISALAGIATSVAAGAYSSCAGTTSGGKCWGANNYGQLGDGSTTNSTTPVNVTGAYPYVAISGGMNHFCAICSSAGVWCWGSGWAGQLGNGAETNSSSPVAVSGLTDIVQLTSGGFHSCAVDNTNQVYCWGLGSEGQMGNGTNTERNSSPITVSGI